VVQTIATIPAPDTDSPEKALREQPVGRAICRQGILPIRDNDYWRRTRHLSPDLDYNQSDPARMDEVACESGFSLG